MVGIKTFDLSDKNLKIGDVFTPIKWGEFAIDKFDLFSKWLNGASIFDPTMGEGNLLESLITFGLSKGFTIENLPTHNLFGNELNTFYFNEAISKFNEKYGLDMSNNFTNEDFLILKPKKFDIIFGNPPWQNFADLPENYKEQIKSYFFKFDLVGNAQNLLLGGSRIDIAALIIKISIKDFLNQDGEAIVFMPLSLFLNDGANRNFRTYSIGEVKYSVGAVFDFNDEVVFDGIATRYGLSHFIRDKKTSFPIPYYRNEGGTWYNYIAKPMFHETDPLSIISNDEGDDFDNIGSMQGRKGVMLNAMLNRGHWWAMLGVGEYNFFPYKVVWEAYGKTTFNPTIFEGNWQANQSLQAFIPVKSLSEAERIQKELSNKQIEKYLLSLKMEGTMNWAQPGKIKKIIKYE